MTSSTTGQIDIDDLARRMDDRFPQLTKTGREIAVAVYRLLALGDPVPDYGIAAAARLDIVEVTAEMEGWPGVYRDEGGRVIAFWGLSTVETAHAMEVDGRELYAWCAWDTLFIPGILGRKAKVRTACGETGEEIVVTVAPHGVESSSHPGAVISLVDPELCDVEGDRIISSFCHHILYFRSRRDGEEWVNRRRDETALLTLDQGFELGRLCNELRLGPAL